jgi:hypothetical protein
MGPIPYKHPHLGWCFKWPGITVIDGAIYIRDLAIKWNSKQPLRLQPKTIAGRAWLSNDDKEPDMYIWLKFNISLSHGWGIGLTYR